MLRERLTIICPVYNEEHVVGLFFARIFSQVEILSENYNVELIFLDNASTDKTHEKIMEIREEHEFVYVIRLSRNVGYQRSLECGLRKAQGDIITFIDVDCEDPPEMIVDFVRYYEEGNDIVYGERVDREEGPILKWMRKVFYKIVKFVADEDFILYMAEFSLFTREVRNAVIQDNDSFPFIRSSIARVGFKRKKIPYKRHSRIAGETNYNFGGMVLFAIASILSATTLPLRLPIYILPFWLIITLILGIFTIKTGNLWLVLANVMFACTYFGGTLAFIALYVARNYKNGLGRPNSIIHSKYTHLPSEGAKTDG